MGGACAHRKNYLDSGSALGLISKSFDHELELLSSTSLMSSLC